MFIDQQPEVTPEEIEEMHHFDELSKVKNIITNGIAKADIPIVINTLVESVLHNGNPLQVAMGIKTMELIIDGVKANKRFKDYAMEELAKYGKDGFISSSVKIEQMNAGGLPNYSACCDPIYNNLEKEIKERKEFLKAVPSAGIEIRHEDELITIYPPNKPASTSTYKITLK